MYLFSLQVCVSCLITHNVLGNAMAFIFIYLFYAIGLSILIQSAKNNFNKIVFANL